MDQDTVQAMLKWLEEVLPELMMSGQNWKLTLHGGKGGDVRYEAQRFGQIVPPRKYQDIRPLQNS